MHFWSSNFGFRIVRKLCKLRLYYHYPVVYYYCPVLHYHCPVVYYHYPVAYYYCPVSLQEQVLTSQGWEASKWKWKNEFGNFFFFGKSSSSANESKFCDVWWLNPTEQQQFSSLMECLSETRKRTTTRTDPIYIELDLHRSCLFVSGTCEKCDNSLLCAGSLILQRWEI